MSIAGNPARSVLLALSCHPVEIAREFRPEIFANEHHKLATVMRYSLVGPYLPGLSGTVLDWGCGDAPEAERIADLGGTVLLYDGAASTRNRLRARYDSHPRIRILDDFLLDEVVTASIDLIIANSVVQNLSTEGLQ